MNLKNTLIIFAVVVVAVVGFFLFGKGGNVLGSEIELIRFEHNETPTGVAAVRVPFLKTLDSPTTVSIFMDGDEVVREAPVQPKENWNTTYYFRLSSEQINFYNIRVVLGNDSVEKVVAPTTYDAGSLFDLASVTDPENAMKGVGVALAQNETIEVTTEGVPDIPQRPGECAPTSAANSLISLISKNGDDEQKPGNPTELIDELKEDMNWTRENGVLPDDFVAGKNAWAARNNIPISTEKVGDTNGISTVEAIGDALQSGQAVELRIKFGNAAGQAVGGHMVTVTGFHTNGEQTYVDVSDPASPEGTDTYEIQGNQLTNYGYWEGVTVLSWGFVQSWTAPTQAQTGTTPDTSSVEMLVIGGSYYPKSQFRVADPDRCNAPHYHAGGTVYGLRDADSTEIVSATDPAPRECGFGRVSEVPVRRIDLTLEQSSALLSQIEQFPPSPGAP